MAVGSAQMPLWPARASASAARSAAAHSLSATVCGNQCLALRQKLALHRRFGPADNTQKRLPAITVGRVVLAVESHARGRASNDVSRTAARRLRASRRTPARFRQDEFRGHPPGESCGHRLLRSRALRPAVRNRKASDDAGPEAKVCRPVQCDDCSLPSAIYIVETCVRLTVDNSFHTTESSLPSFRCNILAA